MTRLDALTRALGNPLVSEDLRQQFLNILTEAEYRLRNFLHQNVLTAYYFGGLFHRGRNPVEPEFWATTEADGVLRRGSYEPFGRRRTVYEPERPSYPLVFLESELAVLLSEKSRLPNAAVANVLSGGEDKTPDEPARAAPQSLGAKTRGIEEAIDQLWPDGQPKGLSAKDRNNDIIDWLCRKGYSVPANPERAIQRVLKARRSR